MSASLRLYCAKGGGCIPPNEAGGGQHFQSDPLRYLQTGTYGYTGACGALSTFL